MRDLSGTYGNFLNKTQHNGKADHKQSGSFYIAEPDFSIMNEYEYQRDTRQNGENGCGKNCAGHGIDGGNPLIILLCDTEGSHIGQGVANRFIEQQDQISSHIAGDSPSPGIQKEKQWKQHDQPDGDAQIIVLDHRQNNHGRQEKTTEKPGM